jgi:hypothetical protein
MFWCPACYSQSLAGDCIQAFCFCVIGVSAAFEGSAHLIELAHQTHLSEPFHTLIEFNLRVYTPRHRLLKVDSDSC